MKRLNKFEKEQVIDFICLAKYKPLCRKLKKLKGFGAETSALKELMLMTRVAKMTNTKIPEGMFVEFLDRTTVAIGSIMDKIKTR